MITDAYRASRAEENAIVGSLPDFPGILATMKISPAIRKHLAGLADELLVHPFPGATLTRSERELLATGVSAGNRCVYCADTHGAFATELLRRDEVAGASEIVDCIKLGQTERLSEKIRALLRIAEKVRENACSLTRDDVTAALAAGASDGDTQLAVLIAAAFCMYNRCVDGFRAKTPDRADAYDERARQIADHGYSSDKTAAVPL
jgi:uncharacterized peroxidase-related enzyme